MEIPDSPLGGRIERKDTVHVLRMKRFHSRVEETPPQAASHSPAATAKTASPSTGEQCYDDDPDADDTQADPGTSAARAVARS